MGWPFTQNIFQTHLAIKESLENDLIEESFFSDDSHDESSDWDESYQL